MNLTLRPNQAGETPAGESGSTPNLKTNLRLEQGMQRGKNDLVRQKLG